MILDLPPSLETAITQKAQRLGMAVNDYIIDLLIKDIQRPDIPFNNQKNLTNTTQNLHA